MLTAKYVAQRLVLYFIVFLMATLINFMVPRAVPGDPIQSMIAGLSMQGELIGGQELVEEYRRLFGLDKDFLTQFFSYLRETFRGNLGYSISYFPSTVSELIVRSLPWTIGLLLTTTVLSWILGTLIGALIGWKGEKSLFGKVFSPIVIALYAIPYWLMAIILVSIFAFTLAILPMSGGYTHGTIPNMSADFVMDVVRHSLLPALSIIIINLGWWYLSMRSMVIRTKGEDFILMAYAKGLKENDIMWNYSFRNNLLPQVTGLALSLGQIIGGALLTETIFAYPGLGWLLYGATTSLDFPLIQGITLMITITLCTATMILDLILPLIDPRIKYGRR